MYFELDFAINLAGCLTITDIFAHLRNIFCLYQLSYFTNISSFIFTYSDVSFRNYLRNVIGSYINSIFVQTVVKRIWSRNRGMEMEWTWIDTISLVAERIHSYFRGPQSQFSNWVSGWITGNSCFDSSHEQEVFLYDKKSNLLWGPPGIHFNA